MSTNGSAWSASGGRHAAGEHFDVIVIGGRCAGSSLATLLVQAGLKVVVVEQATFPKETLSSHLMEADGLQFLHRLGVTDAIRKTGVRFMKQLDVRFNDLRIETKWPLRFDDLGGAAFLRRHYLDSILADAALEAGADVRMGTKLVEVLWDKDRVCGARVQKDGTETRLFAPLVVGADGRTSTVAYMVGSRKYNLQPNERSYYFTFFEGATESSSDTFVFHRWGDRMVWAGAADAGLYLVGVSPEGHERDYFRTNTAEGLLAHMRRCEPTAAALENAKIATKIAGIRKFDGYFREPSGRGWVLVGDSGHFKDPSVGRGIGDAFAQVEALVPAIVNGLDGTGDGLDAELARWGAWRDRRLQGYYWLAADVGKAGAFPSMVPEAMKRLQAKGELHRFFDLFSHRTDYYDVFPLREVGLATGRMLLSGETKRVPLVREAITLLAKEPRRRWINRRPALISSDTTVAPTDRLRTTERTARAERPPVERTIIERPGAEPAVPVAAVPVAAVADTAVPVAAVPVAAVPDTTVAESPAVPAERSVPERSVPERSVPERLRAVDSRSEGSRSEPARAEPPRAEPARVELPRPEPARAALTRADITRVTENTLAQIARTDTTRSDSARTDSDFGPRLVIDGGP